MKIAVTGAAGHLGSRVVAHLQKKIDTKDIVALVHNKNHATALINEGLETREIDFQKRESLEKAFVGIDTLVYVASKTYSVFDRVGELENVLAAVKKNEIKNLVAMSFITLEDSAEAMATMALNEDVLKSRRIYLLTQSRSYTMPELGKIMTKVTGHEIGYHPVSVEEFGKIYAAEGDGAELASMYKGGAMGYLHGLSDDFAHLTGHEPEAMEHFLTRSYHE